MDAYWKRRGLQLAMIQNVATSDVEQGELTVANGSGERSGSNSCQTVRVLIVDDQEIFANALQLFLDGRDGIEVVGVARDGPQAIDLALMTGADVVLMDIGLPIFDGFEATRRLLAIKPSAKVIALTGLQEEEAASEARAAGAVAFMTKGAIHQEIVGVIHSAAHHH